jgi:predicted NBD/HSP70 family sugar kinase
MGLGPLTVSSIVGPKTAIISGRGADNLKPLQVETLMHSALSPFSNTVAETTNGPATLRRGAKLGGATYLS